MKLPFIKERLEQSRWSILMKAIGMRCEKGCEGFIKTKNVAVSRKRYAFLFLKTCFKKMISS